MSHGRDLSQACRDYQRVEQAIRYLQEHYGERPSLEELAGRVGLSPFHFQRLFRRWAGVTPKQFLQYLTLGHAKRALRRMSVLEAAYESGLSGPGRLHDLFVSVEAVTPGEYRSRGQGLSIRYAFQPSPLGECLLGFTERGVCLLLFVTGDKGELLERARRRWPLAQWIEEREGARSWAERIFSSRLDGPPLHLRGTNFQLQVWQALLRIPPGWVVSYEEIARAVGRPKAFRAVGAAVAANPLTYLIPCHRVIRNTGEPGNYSGGELRKRILLAWEGSRTEAKEGSGRVQERTPAGS